MSRRIAHLSDFHFGRVDERLVRPLLASLENARPDLVVVTGDFTQRARRVEFEDARRVLDGLPCPWLVVPGNHDIPLWNALLRFFAPRWRWSRYLRAPWTSTWRDDQLVVVGISSPRGWLAKEGAVSRAQVEHVRRELQDAPRTACRLVALHHPLAVPSELPRFRIALGAGRTIEALHDCRVDAVLSGHLHLSGLHHVADALRRGVLLVQSPSTLSTRLRGESNGYNLIDLGPDAIRVGLVGWDEREGAFVPQEPAVHPRRGADGAADG